MGAGAAAVCDAGADVQHRHRAQGKIYSPNTGDLLDILNFAGDLGTGLLYVVAKLFDLGQAAVVTVTGDYGTKFMVVAGLLNVIAAVDAHSLATGRKAS